MTTTSTPRPESRTAPQLRPARWAVAPERAASAARTARDTRLSRPLPPARRGRTALLGVFLLLALTAAVLLALPGEPVVVGRSGPDVLGALAVLVALAAATALGVAGLRRASWRAGEPVRLAVGLLAAIVVTATWAAVLGGLLLAASVVGVDRWTAVGDVDGHAVVVRESTSVTGLRVAVGVRDGWRVRVGSTPGGALSSPR